jgi:hypothetical protein
MANTPPRGSGGSRSKSVDLLLQILLVILCPPASLADEVLATATYFEGSGVSGQQAASRKNHWHTGPGAAGSLLRGGRGPARGDRELERGHASPLCHCSFLPPWLRSGEGRASLTNCVPPLLPPQSGNTIDNSWCGYGALKSSLIAGIGTSNDLRSAPQSGCGKCLAVSCADSKVRMHAQGISAIPGAAPLPSL